MASKPSARAPIPVTLTPMPDELVPDPQVGREFKVTSMTIWRWDHDPEMAALGWPPPIIIRKRKYRHRLKLESFKQRLVKQAVHDRKHPREAEAAADA